VQGAVAQVNVNGQYQKWLAVCESGGTDYFMVSRSNGNDYDLYEGQLGGDNGSGALVTELNVGSNQISTFLSQDCLTTYFASDASGNTQIYTAQRATPTSTWSTPTEVMTFDTATTDKDPWMSTDQLTFYFDSEQFTGTNAGNRAVYVSTR
jgi:Tol biopolymer transport system component